MGETARERLSILSSRSGLTINTDTPSNGSGCVRHVRGFLAFCASASCVARTSPCLHRSGSLPRNCSRLSLVDALIGAEMFAVLRRMALNMLKHENTLRVGIAAKRKRAGWDHDYLLKALSQ